MKEKIEEISLSMERGHRRTLRVLGVLLAVGLFVLLWKWRGPAALEPLIDGRHAPVDTRRSGKHRHRARSAVGALPAAVAAAGPVRPDGSVLLRVFPAPVRRLECGAEPRRRACRAAAPARARRRGAVVRAGRACRSCGSGPWRWASAGCTVAALGMVYDAVRVLQVPGRATFCDLGIVIQVYREVS